MTEETTALRKERDRLDIKLSELTATIDEVQARIDTVTEDIATALEARETGTKALLPDDRLPESVDDETRGEIASYLDSLGEKRDVRSEKVEMKTDELKAETKSATDARDDIDEISAVIDRLEKRTAVAESKVGDAHEELDAARNRFADELAVLASRFASFDIDLSKDTLGEVIEEEIPARTSEMQASVESVREQIATLSTRKSKLTDEREKLHSIEGGGTCPTCNQNVGPELNESEAEAIKEELHEVERRMGTADQERNELITAIEELNELREKAISLRSFRSETVAEAAGRLEDRQENFADIRADLKEERTELAEAKAERDRAEAAIATLEIEIKDLEAEIDRLQAKSNKAESCLAAFDAVDKLRAQREQLEGKLADLQESAEETNTERSSIDAEIEALTDE